MIKLTQLLFSIKEETQKKLDDIQAMMQEEHSRAESMALGTAPSPYRYKMQDSDYNKAEVPLYIHEYLITSVTTNIEGDTIIETSLGKEYIVKESPRKVYNIISKALEENGEN